MSTETIAATAVTCTNAGASFWEVVGAVVVGVFILALLK